MPFVRLLSACFDLSDCVKLVSNASFLVLEASSKFDSVVFFPRGLGSWPERVFLDPLVWMKIRFESDDIVWSAFLIISQRPMLPLRGEKTWAEHIRRRRRQQQRQGLIFTLARKVFLCWLKKVGASFLYFVAVASFWFSFAAVIFFIQWVSKRRHIFQQHATWQLMHNNSNGVSHLATVLVRKTAPIRVSNIPFVHFYYSLMMMIFLTDQICCQLDDLEEFGRSKICSSFSLLANFSRCPRSFKKWPLKIENQSKWDRFRKSRRTSRSSSFWTIPWSASFSSRWWSQWLSALTLIASSSFLPLFSIAHVMKFNHPAFRSRPRLLHPVAVSPFGSNWVGRVWAISLLSPNFCRNAKFIRFFLLLFLRLQSFVSFRERTARLFLAASCPIARALPLSLARPQACMTTTTTTRHVAADDGFHKVREEMLFDGEMELNGLEGPKTTFSFPPVGCLIRPPSQRSRWTLYCCFFVAKWKWNKISSLFSTVCFRYWSFLLECATTNKMNFLATGVSSHRRRCCSSWHRFEVCRTRFRDDQFRFRTLARKNISRQKNHFSDWIFNFGCIWLIRCLG